MPPEHHLDQYLRQFSARRRITLVGPMLANPPTDLEAPLIWVDGGADQRGDSPEIAGFSVGDGDSAHRRLDQYLDADKNYSDLAFVLRRLPAHFTEVILLGFLGGRRDHELFNLGEVHHFLAAAKTPTRARFERSARAYSKGQWRFNAHGLFSLAALEATIVQLTGACKYPLPAPTPMAALTSRGLSNQGFGEITLTTQAPVFVFHPA